MSQNEIAYGADDKSYQACRGRGKTGAHRLPAMGQQGPRARPACLGTRTWAAESDPRERGDDMRGSSPLYLIPLKPSNARRRRCHGGKKVPLFLGQFW